MESRPVEVYPVHDYLRSRLCSLYENDSIFDRFECGWNGDDAYPLCTNYVNNYRRLPNQAMSGSLQACHRDVSIPVGFKNGGVSP